LETHLLGITNLAALVTSYMCEPPEWGVWSVPVESIPQKPSGIITHGSIRIYGDRGSMTSMVSFNNNNGGSGLLLLSETGKVYRYHYKRDFSALTASHGFITVDQVDWILD
jgi:hypothetical protein